jgi:hypothetical protein
MKFSQDEKTEMTTRNRCHHTIRVLDFYNLKDSGSNWSKSHCQMPTPYLHDDKISVLFTTRDSNGISRISQTDLDLDLKEIDSTNAQKPILDIGLHGTFDQHGVMCSSILKTKNEYLMYYIGWNTETEYPYSLSIGLAASEDWSSGFTKVNNEPTIKNNFDSGIFSTTPFVWSDSANYNILYSKGKPWIKQRNNYESRYGIASASSKNGRDWTPNPSFNPTIFDEDYSYARPVMVNIQDVSHILYSKRSNKDFRTGTGVYNIRMSRILPDSKWIDCTLEFEQNSLFRQHLSAMQCYAHPLQLNGKTLIFMNGDSFGKFGFAVAELLT